MGAGAETLGEGAGVGAGAGGATGLGIKPQAASRLVSPTMSPLRARSMKDTINLLCQFSRDAFDACQFLDAGPSHPAHAAEALQQL